MSKYSKKYEDVAKHLIQNQATRHEYILVCEVIKMVRSEFDELRFENYYNSLEEGKIDNG